MSRPGTVGEILDLALGRVEAELRACRETLYRRGEEYPSDFDLLSAFDDHLIEALDGVLAASAAAGAWRTARVLREAAGRHGFSVVEDAGGARAD